MIRLTQYINEELKKFPIWCEISLAMFKSAKNLTKENIKDMLSAFCDVEGRFKKFSDYLLDTYPKEYVAYQPSNDEFISKNNNDKICDQIAEFILKYIIK